MRRLLIAALAALLLVSGGCETREEASRHRRLERQIRKLRSDDPDMSVQAAVTIGNKGPDARRAIPALIEALSRKEGAVRRHAAYALGKMGPAARDAVPHLEKLLKDENAVARIWAVQALVRIDPQARPHVDVIVQAMGHSDPGVRINAAGAVELIGHRAEAAIPALIAGLEDREFRRHAARALGAIGPAARDAIGPLTRLADGSDIDAVAAQEALKKIRG